MLLPGVPPVLRFRVSQRSSPSPLRLPFAASYLGKTRPQPQLKTTNVRHQRCQERPFACSLLPFLALFLLLFDRRAAPNGTPSKTGQGGFVARWESATVDTAADSYGLPAKQMQRMYLFTVHAREPIDAVCRAKRRAFIAALGRFDVISGVNPTLLHQRLATVSTHRSHSCNFGRNPNKKRCKQNGATIILAVGRSWLPSVRRCRSS